jgi:hypothetical protein
MDGCGGSVPISLRGDFPNAAASNFELSAIVRPLESIAETQPQLKPALLRLSAIISQYFILCRAWLLYAEELG